MEKFLKSLASHPAFKGYMRWRTRPIIVALCCYLVYSAGKSVGEAVYYLLH